MKSTYDAVIVGARCAGAATALLLARQGLSVLAIDRSAYGSDVLSTHALMRGGVLQLDRWGVLDAVLATGTPPIQRVAFHYGDDVVDVPLRPHDGRHALYAPRRTVLDARLVDEARRAGADIVHGPRLMDLLRRPDDRVNGASIEIGRGDVRQIRSRIVIGADGVSSSVARLAGAAEYRTWTHASAIIYGYWAGLPDDAYHWMYREGAGASRESGGVGAGVIPTNGGLACVFASMPAARLMWDLRRDLAGSHRQVIAAISRTPAALIEGRPAITSLRGFAGRPGYLRQSVGPGWALVGDAGCFKDPITAHGITDALRDAEMLASAVARDSDRALAEYQEERDALSIPMLDATDEIASYAWSMDRLRELHKIMRVEMQREVRWIAGLTVPGLLHS